MQMPSYHNLNLAMNNMDLYKAAFTFVYAGVL